MEKSLRGMLPELSVVKKAARVVPVCMAARKK